MSKQTPPCTKLTTEMTTGGMMIRNGGENNDEIHYYRYVVSHKKAPVYTHGHILAIANGTVENVVEVFELPNIETPLTPTQLGFDESEYISINQCQQKFGVGSRHLAISKSFIMCLCSQITCYVSLT